MANEIKQKRKRVKGSSSGRATPKKVESSRYTPPIPGGSHKPSSIWVPIFMFGFFGIGVIIIILNYLPASLLPGQPDNKYLLVGLLSICLGFIAATRYR